MIEYLLEKITGKPKYRRDYEKWAKDNILYNASTVQHYYHSMKYVIPIDYYKVFTRFDPLAHMIESTEFLDFITSRPLGQHTEYRIFRGNWDSWDKRFYIQDISGTDQLFAATNVEEDASWIALRWK